MCGLAGIIGKGSFHRALDSMLAASHHRGPDMQGNYIKNGAFIGHNRLSIIDTSEAGVQPILSDDGRYVFIYNGEVYNFQQKRRQLEAEGIQFKSKTDSEVIFQLYIKYKEGCLKHLRGMFAFVVWDTVERQLFAARDSFGIKPFLYTLKNDAFLFASEMKAMIASGLVSKNYNQKAIYQFLNIGHIIPPDTLFDEVRSLPPGHFLRYSEASRQVQIQSFLPEVQNGYDNSNLPKSYEGAVEQVRDLVIDAVREELVSDVPLGIFLSGGLDSSVLTAAARAASNADLETFSIGFAQDSEAIDESVLAKESADFFGTKHHACIISERDFAQEFPNFIHSIDQPSIDGYNTYFVSKFARERVTVALSGLGGDELFGGYNWNKVVYKELNKRKYPALQYIPQQLEALVPERYRRRFYLEKSKHSFQAFYPFIFQVFWPFELQQLLRQPQSVPEGIRYNTAGVARHINTEEVHLLRKTSMADRYIFMASRLLRDSDVTGMIHSLEVRFPLIDNRIAALTQHLDPSFIWDQNFLLANGVAEKELNFEQNRVKKLLFDAFAESLPPTFSRRGKTGFKMPHQHWIMNNWDQVFADYYFSDPLELFQANALENLFQEWKAGKFRWPRIWNIIVLNALISNYQRWS